MIKKINNTERINRELRKAGKITVLNKPKHIKAILELNEQMKNVRREYKLKNWLSEKSASETPLL